MVRPRPRDHHDARSRTRAPLDSLDPHRRFERVHPELAARVDAALRLDAENAARTLLDLAEQTLGERADFPTEAAAAIRARLGWA